MDSLTRDVYKDGKLNVKPRRHHGFSFLLFLMGTLFPPLAVAARFGIGGDFWLNLLLTICGYIPGHVHNFYIQNIRNNKGKRRTPKWAIRYGLVDTSDMERKKKKSQWAQRYDERLPHSALESQEFAEGQEIRTQDLEPESSGQANGDQQLWTQGDERYYGQNGDAGSTRSGGSSRWHYPANFDDADIPRAKSTKKKKSKKDRWARTEDAYNMPEERPKRKKTKKKSRSTVGDADSVDRRSDSIAEFPEDAEGGLYGDRQAAPSTNGFGQLGDRPDRDELAHDF